MAIGYLRGFIKWTVTITLPQWVMFTVPIWARTSRDAVKTAGDRYGRHAVVSVRVTP